MICRVRTLIHPHDCLKSQELQLEEVGLSPPSSSFPTIYHSRLRRRRRRRRHEYSGFLPKFKTRNSLSFVNFYSLCPKSQCVSIAPWTLPRPSSWYEFVKILNNDKNRMMASLFLFLTRRKFLGRWAVQRHAF